MNYPGHGAADPWCGYRPVVAGEAAAAVVAGDTSSFADMIWDYPTDDDLFGLEWEQGGGGAGAAAPGSPAPPEVRFGHPPSEEERTAWLRAIVKAEEPAAFNDDEQTDVGGRDVPAKGFMTTTMGQKEKLLLPMAEEEGMGTKQQQEMRKTPGGGGSPRRSRCHHGEAHNLTEKRRRNKINERFRTLQQLVPGCDKCNQASTLDHTIQYMKSLQRQVHAMCVGGTARPTAAAYPVVQQAPQHAPPAAPPVAVPMMPAAAAPVVLAAAPTMVPFTAMIQLPRYPAAAVPAVMMHAAAVAVAPAVAPGGARSTASHRKGSSSTKGNGSSRSLRQKQGK